MSKVGQRCPTCTHTFGLRAASPIHPSPTGAGRRRGTPDGDARAESFFQTQLPPWMISTSGADPAICESAPERSLPLVFCGARGRWRLPTGSPLALVPGAQACNEAFESTPLHGLPPPREVHLEWSIRKRAPARVGSCRHIGPIDVQKIS
jgi:hypothetical protein